ncbi:MAG: AIR synthase-related protein, partial [Acidobacteriota bacterium]
SVSEYAQTILGFSTDELIENGEVPVLDLDLEKKVQQTCLDLIDRLLINSAHDCSDGGLAVTIAESCFSSLNRQAIGAEVDLKNENLAAEAQLFGESPSRILISFAPEDLEKVKEITVDCPFEVLGKIGGETLNIKLNDKKVISAKTAELENIWKNSLEKQLKN